MPRHATCPTAIARTNSSTTSRRVTNGAPHEPLAGLLIRGSATIAPWLQSNGVQLQDPASGVMPYSRRTAFFLGGGKAMINALYATATTLGVTIGYDSEVVALRFRRTRRIARSMSFMATRSNASRRRPWWSARAAIRPISPGCARALAPPPMALRSAARLIVDRLRSCGCCSMPACKPVGDPASNATWWRSMPEGRNSTAASSPASPRFPTASWSTATAKRFHDEGEDARKTHYARWGAADRRIVPGRSPI